MDFTEKTSPLTPSKEHQEKFNAWLAAYKRNEKCDVDVYGKPTEKQLEDLERVRSISKELQDNIHELEKGVVTEEEVAEMTAPAEDIDFTDQHEFMSGDAADDADQVDVMSAKEEEKQRLTSGKAAKSEIQNFYKDQCVFLTGGTGFLGKVLIEKLLRSCADIDTIYVLIRDKKGKSAATRLQELLDEFLFHKAHEVNPKGIHKVVAVNGDMEAPGLGLSERDRNTLLERSELSGGPLLLSVSLLALLLAHCPFRQISLSYTQEAGNAFVTFLGLQMSMDSFLVARMLVCSVVL